jgi:hypothetical protein
MYFLNILNKNFYVNIKISKEVETLYEKKIIRGGVYEKKIGDLSKSPLEVLS